METKSIARSTFEEIKEKIIEISKISSTIHVRICAKRKKVEFVESTICGIYDNFILVKSNVNGYLEDFCISYSDILTKRVIISEIS